MAGKPQDISPIIDIALLYNRSFATKDIHTIHLWITQGADIEKDILPTMKRLMGTSPYIRTFSYFSNAIMEAKTKREASELKLTPVPSDPDAVRKKAQRMAWVRDRVHQVRLSIDELQWLEQYERTHGKLSP